MKNIQNKELQKRLLLSGADEYTSTFFETDNYEELSQKIASFDEEDLRKLEFKKIPIDLVLETGRYVINKHTKGIDIKVYYTDGDTLKKKIIAEFGPKPEKSQYQAIIKFIKERASLIDITAIPVSLKDRDRPDAYIKDTTFFETDEVDLSFYENLGYYVYEIGLEGDIDAHMQTTYIHELYHGLLNRNKGSIKNLLLYEALPIFMEKVAMLDLEFSEDLCNLNDYVRLLYTKIRIKYMPKNSNSEKDLLQIIENETYILSLLLATALFDIYEQASKQVRENIDNDINDVLSGNSALDDVFKKYGATEELGYRVLMEQINFLANHTKKI